MFTLLIDRKYRVLLTRFSGILRHEVLLAQAVAAREIAASESLTRGLLDVSAVQRIDMSLERTTVDAEPDNTARRADDLFAPTARRSPIRFSTTRWAEWAAEVGGIHNKTAFAA